MFGTMGRRLRPSKTGVAYAASTRMPVGSAADMAGERRRRMLHSGHTERRAETRLAGAPARIIVADAELVNEEPEQLRRVGLEALGQRDQEPGGGAMRLVRRRQELLHRVEARFVGGLVRNDDADQFGSDGQRRFGRLGDDFVVAQQHGIGSAGEHPREVAILRIEGRRVEFQPEHARLRGAVEE